MVIANIYLKMLSYCFGRQINFNNLILKIFILVNLLLNVNYINLLLPLLL